VTVLAGGTSAEELIEGLSIGIGAAIKPGLGLLIAIAIVIDNLSEALSIGELIRTEQTGQAHRPVRRILGWTGLISVALFGSALAGWVFLRGLSHPLLGCLFGTAGGGLFYLTITDLVPQAEERHYQQSAALSMAAGFMFIFILSRFL
jgi:ZIP family zinc transporter